MHAVALTLSKDVHAAVIGVVHVVLDHVFRATTDVFQCTTVVGAIGLGGVGDEVVGTTGTIAPDVAQVEPVSHFVRSRASEVVRTGAWAVDAHIGISAHHAVGSGWTAWELRITEQSTPEVADPVIQVVSCRPSIRAALGREFHGVIRAKAGYRGGHAQNPRAGCAIGVAGCQTEFDFGIRSLRPDVVLIGIGPAEVVIQHLQLFQNLSIRNVLGLVGIQHVEHHGNGHHNGLHLGAILTRLLAGRDKGGRLGFKICMTLGIDSVESHHLHVVLMCSTTALCRRFRGLDLGKSRNGEYGEEGRKKYNSHGLIRLAAV